MRPGHPPWSSLPRQHRGAEAPAAPERSGPAAAIALGFFGLVFAAAGLASIFFLLPQAVHEGAREGVVVAAVLGVLFMAAGLGIAWLAVRGLAQQRQGDALVAAHPDSPWLWRRDWATGRVEGSARMAAIGLWVFCGIWNLISWPIVPRIVEEVSRNNRGAGVGLLFPVVGLGLLAAAVHATLRARRFGRAVLLLQTLPGVIGGQLVGRVRTSRPLEAPRGVSARLVCVRRVTTGSGKNRSTHESVLFEDKQELPASEVGPGPTGSEMALAFRIPYDCRESDTSRPRDSIEWRVEVSAELSGVDFGARFEVPVFRTGESSPEVVEVAVPAPPIQAGPEPTPLSPGSKVRVRRLPDGGVELYLPPARNLGAAVLTTLFAAGWTAVTWLIAFETDAPLLFPVVFGFFDLLLVLAALSLWLSSTRVRASRDGLRVRSGWLGAGRERRTTAGEIERFALQVGMQQGQRAFYRLEAKRRGGGSLGCGWGLPDKREALALAALLAQALGVEDPPRDPAP